MSSPPQRPTFQQPPPRRKRLSGVWLALAAAAVLVAALWFIILRPPSGDYEYQKPNYQGTLQRYESEKMLMGTLFTIVVYSPSKLSASDVMASAFDRAAEIEKICSDYDPASELSLLSTAEIGQPLLVSETLLTVLAHAKLTAEVTNGAFDPTLGPVTKLWREARNDKQLPDTDKQEESLSRTSWQDFSVDLTTKTITLHKEGMAFDLGAIAKGYAADEMYQLLRDKGHPIALIAAGGDLRLGNPPPDETSWRVGLVTLGENSSEFINVANCAVSTSGDLYNFLEINGKRYSHIIDPATGFGLTRRIAATVIAPTATQSDPYATFACINPDKAYESFSAGEISVRIVTLDGEEPSDHRSLNFPEVFAP